MIYEHFNGYIINFIGQKIDINLLLYFYFYFHGHINNTFNFTFFSMKT